MLKPVSGGIKKIIITKKVRGFVAGHFSGQWRENSLPQTILTILTCSIDQPRPSSVGQPRTQQAPARRGQSTNTKSVQQLSQRRSVLA
jgi:hypothetical protein